MTRMSRTLACQGLRGQGGSRGELVPVTLYVPLYRREGRTGTDIIDNVPVHSHWLGGRRTSYGAGLLVSKFTGVLGTFWHGQVLGLNFSIWGFRPFQVVNLRCQ
jgi:hypothetical protein